MSHVAVRRLAACAALLAAGCARNAAPEGDAEPVRNLSEEAVQCARSTAQAAGFSVRVRDPRNPWYLVAEGTSTPDRIVIRLIPGPLPESHAIVRATAEGPRNTLAGMEARTAARSIESRCGQGAGEG